jgi:phage baseplate assembly protein W
MADIPHLAMPFKYVAGKPVVVEQGSEDEIAQCVEVVLRTHPGQRKELPDFGCADLAFRAMPLHTADLDAAIARDEPRAVDSIDQIIDGLNLKSNITVNVSNREGGVS